jgi:competence protein ComGF
MNKRGAILMETLFGAIIALLILSLAAGLLTIFWQTWRQITDAGRERHYVSTTVFWLAKDLDRANSVMVSASILTIDIPGARVQYRQSGDDSFYRRVGQTIYTSLAAGVRSVRFREEGGLIWVTITFTNGEVWETCFSHPQNQGP